MSVSNNAEISLSDSAYEILRDAVNVARALQVGSLKVLRSHLARRWPGRDADINEAINHWSASVRKRHPNGL